MQIRNEQMSVFQNNAEENFVRRCKAMLKEHRSYVTDDYSDDQLDTMIRNGIARARTHGIESEIALFRFVDLMFGVAPNFDNHPMVQDFLTTSPLHPDDRIAALVTLFSPLDWEEVKKLYDFTAWGLTDTETPSVNTDMVH